MRKWVNGLESEIAKRILYFVMLSMYQFYLVPSFHLNPSTVYSFNKIELKAAIMLSI
jgi:hypothetical protein